MHLVNDSNGPAVLKDIQTKRIAATIKVRLASSNCSGLRKILFTNKTSGMLCYINQHQVTRLFVYFPYAKVH